MCYCDACGKKFRPPIITDNDGNFAGFDFLCSSCNALGQMVDTEEAIRRYDWQTVTTINEVMNPVENLLNSYPIVDSFD